MVRSKLIKNIAVRRLQLLSILNINTLSCTSSLNLGPRTTDSLCTSPQTSDRRKCKFGRRPRLESALSLGIGEPLTETLYFIDLLGNVCKYDAK